MRTTVRVYVRGIDGEEDSFTSSINASEKEAHEYYYGKWWNMGIVDDKMMRCYKVETL